MARCAWILADCATSLSSSMTFFCSLGIATHFFSSRGVVEEVDETGALLALPGALPLLLLVPVTPLTCGGCCPLLVEQASGSASCSAAAALANASEHSPSSAAVARACASRYS